MLKRAGLAAAAGSSITLAGDASRTLAAPVAITAENVKAHGALGDGAADDAEAIQAALEAVPEAGGAVYFPPGDYLVGRRLVPRSQTLMFGCHSPRYHPVANPDSACRIRAKGAFAGDGLLEPEGSAQGITIRNLALVGDGAKARAGIRMPDLPEVTGEQAWTLENVTIAGFEHGIEGRVHVFSLLHCHIHSNEGWGIYASEGNRWNDSHLANCFLYFNRSGNLFFGGQQQSAAVEFVNCRFERAGNRYGSPLEPLNPGAPGIKLESARFLSFTNCYTDANAGNGVEIEGASAVALSNIYFTGCIFNRDGTGQGESSRSRYAGVKVKGATPTGSAGANHMKFANCLVGTGTPDDEGGGPTGPAYGVWYENTEDFQWIGGRAEGVTSAFYVGTGNNSRPAMVDTSAGFLTLPLSPPADAVSDGMAYFDAATGKLLVRSGAQWKSVTLR